MAVRIEISGTILWALRADDPDKTVPGRVWTTEVTIGWDGQGVPSISVRQIVSSPEKNLSISPHTPGFVQQISERCNLRSGPISLSSKPWIITDLDEVSKLIDLLENRDRRLTVIVASGDERSADPSSPIIDGVALTRATLGLAQVVLLPAHLTYSLSDAFGRARSVFHGGVRTYLPGFDAASDPYEHRLFLADAVRDAPEQHESMLRIQVAQESLRRTRIGHDVLSFASVRSAALRLEQEQRVAVGASESDQLEAARRRIEALEIEIITAKSESDRSFQTAVDEEDRAKLAESQWNNARARIKHLEEIIKNRGTQQDIDEAEPDSWDSLADWADQAFMGRLVLAPAARRGVKEPLFSDVRMAARSLKWLATVCLDRRVNGGGPLSNISIEPGLENAPCGSDTFEFDFRAEPDLIESGGIPKSRVK
ncbi:MAG TPA: hypothetical protein VGV17_01175 [Bosea sp. (in: a-proteobacteria)]|jgi:hypothetical protein|uniref:hypothetical protein n=1 Tax=Bosea sp. (in: a-proteobacteria) TaxID=1871050 RepID=UPI002DDCA5D2|nr:hypothetical protein [Bosea sp. (in: a-proteobacteria)]HEV2552352.1 hypothetical protein [Bosea sp. (in: a-proteobacteria)]